MVQRVDFPQITNLGNVSDPVNPQDAATLAWVNATQGVYTLQPGAPTSTLGTVAIVGIAVAGTDFRITGNVANLVFQGSPLRFGADTQTYTAQTVSFDGATTRVVFSPPLSASTGAVPIGTTVLYGASTDLKVNTLVIGDNLTAVAQATGVVRLNATGGGGGNVPLINLAETYILDSTSLVGKVNNSAPNITGVSGTIGAVADYSGITITSSWPPPAPTAGFNPNYAGIADSTNLSWAGFGFIGPLGLTNIVWVRQPPANSSFTGAGVWYVANAVAQSYVGTTVANATNNPVALVTYPDLTLTPIAGGDTFGGPATQITASPLIASLIGSAPVPPAVTLISTGAQVASFASNVFTVASAQVAGMATGLLSVGNGIVQSTSGNWTLPANPIFVSLTATPTGAQYSTITQINQADANSMTITIANLNNAYFAGTSYPQSFFIRLQNFTFQNPPQTEILRLAGTVVSAGVQNFAIRDDVTYACKDANNSTFAGIITGDRATATISFALAVADGTTVSNIAITFTSAIPATFLNGTSIVTFATPSLFNITLSNLTVAGSTYTLSGELNTVNNTSVPAGTYNVVIARSVIGTSNNVRALRNVPQPGASQATWGWQVQGDTAPFTTQVLEAGSYISFDTDPVTGQPRINANLPANLGRGWIISVDWEPNNFPVSAGWTGNDAIPRFLRNGTVVPTTGINSVAYWGQVRNWVSGNPDIPDTQFVANLYAAWNNSFSDALQVAVSVEDASGRWQIRTQPPTSDPNQTDLVVQGLFNVNNSNGNFEHISGIQYDDAGGTYIYQRAIGSQVIQSDNLQQVLNAGNRANNQTGTPNNTSTIILDDVSGTPTITTTLAPGGLFTPKVQLNGPTSGSATINAPATIATPYTITLPAAQATAAGQTLVNNGSGVLSWGASAGTFQATLNAGNVASTASSGTASFTLSDPASGALSTFSPSLANVYRLRLSTVAETNTTDIINSPGVIASYTITLPTGQSNNANNVLYVNASGISSFNLPSLALQTFSNYVASGFTVAAGASGGDITLVIASDATATLFPGATFAFDGTGLNRNTVVTSSFSNPNTTITLIAPLISSVALGAGIFVPTTSTATRVTTINASSGITASASGGVLSLAAIGGGGGNNTIGNVIYTAWNSTSLNNANVQAIGDETITINGNASSTIFAGDNISFVSGGSPRYTVDQVTYNSGPNTTTVLLYTPLVAALTSGQLIYKGAIDSTTQRVSAINVGAGLEYAYVGGILTLINSATGGIGSIPSLDQVTGVGANSTRAISVQATGFNGISLNIPPTLAAAAGITAIGPGANAGISIASKGSASVFLGSTDLTLGSLGVAGSALGPVLTGFTGSGGGSAVVTINTQTAISDGTATPGLLLVGGIDRGMSTSGSGVLYINNANAGVQFSFTGTASSITSSGASAAVDLNLSPKSTANLVLGNVTSFAGLTLSGNQASSAILSATGPGANLDISLDPKGTGVVQAVGTLSTIRLELTSTTQTTIRNAGLATNIDFQLLPKGGGATLLGNVATFSGLRIGGGSSLATTIQAENTTATDLILNVLAKGAGVLFLGNGNNQLQLTSTTTGFTLAPNATIGTNVPITINSRGTSPVVVGNPTNSLNVAGTAANLIMSATAANANFVIQPNGTGDFYPLGSTILPGVTNQPQLFVAQSSGSLTLSAGNFGQAILSAGNANGANFYGSPVTGGNKTIIGITSTAAGDQTNDESGFMTTGGTFNGTFNIVLNGLNLTVNQTAGNITNWVVGATYEVKITSYWSTTLANARTSYWCAVRSVFPQSFVVLGDGCSTCTTRTTTPRGGDALPSTGIGYWTPTAANTALNLTYFTDALGTGNSGSLNLILIIERLT